MPSFHYVALNQEQKELSGIIETPTEGAAREKLNELGLSIVSLNPTETSSKEAEKEPSVHPFFEFEARDKNGKKVIGTIVAENIIHAYGRLFDEYQLDVTFLANAGLSPEEKETLRKTGIATLQKEYEQSSSRKKKKEDENEKKKQAEENNRRELLEKVEFTMRQVENFLKEYGPDLKIEEKETIQAYLNQLLRIKDSTNLEHIRSTCERMLAHLQKQELFLHEEQKTKESTKVKVETHSLLKELKRTGLKQDIDLIKSLTRFKDYPIFKPIANVLLGLFQPKNPEIIKLRNEIKMVNQHMFAYFKIFLTEKAKAVKLEAWESIKTLRGEKKRLKLQIHAIKEKQRSQALTERNQDQWNASKWEASLSTFFGWLLAFYIFSYIISYPLSMKTFEWSISQNIFFYHTKFIKALTLLFFIAYGSITMRIFWLSKNALAIYLLYPFAIFGYLLLIINLL